MTMTMRVTAPTLTWDDLLEEYFFSHHLRPITEISYRRVVNVLLSFIGKQSLPEALTHYDVLRWRRCVLKEKNQSTHTWNNKVAHLRALFNFGIKQGFFPFEKNPFNETVVQKDKKKKKILERPQLIQVYVLMQQMEGEEKKELAVWGGRCALRPAWFWLTVLDTLRYTGMRQNQLLRIQLRDVNFEEGYIHLRLEGSKTHWEWRVPIVQALKIRLGILVARAQQAGATPSDFLFDVTRFLAKSTRHHPDRTPEAAQQKTHQKLRAFFRKLSVRCGFDVSSHRFRHTLATELMKAPERNLQLVKDLLGHSSVTTTTEYIELRTDIVGKTLERELALYTDLCTERD